MHFTDYRKPPTNTRAFSKASCARTCKQGTRACTCAHPSMRTTVDGAKARQFMHSQQTFDASEAFTFYHDTLSDPQWTVICLKVHALASTGAELPVLPPLQ